MNDAVNYVAFNVDHISDVTISREDEHYFTVNVEVKLYDKEELDEIWRILQKYHENKN